MHAAWPGTRLTAVPDRDICMAGIIRGSNTYFAAEQQHVLGVLGDEVKLAGEPRHAHRVVHLMQLGCVRLNTLHKPKTWEHAGRHTGAH